MTAADLLQWIDGRILERDTPDAQRARAAAFRTGLDITAEAAIAYVRAGLRIDVIFTDIQLGGHLSGWDVAEQFRAARADAPVIYTSGNAADRSREVRGSLFFDKPYLAAEIVDACGRLA